MAAPVKGIQETVSEGHPWHSRKREKIKGDVGGDFYTKKQYVIDPNRIVHIEGSSFAFGDPAFWTHHTYDGPIHPADFDVSTNRVFPPSAESGTSSLNALGATAIARCKPTNSVADVATFLGELMKEGLPSLVGSQTWKDRSVGPKQAGSEFLNVEFGWLPIVDDVRSFAHAVRHADTVLKQYERDAGRIVRRRYNFPQKTEQLSQTKLTLASNFYNGVMKPGPGSPIIGAPYGDGIRTHTVSRRQWFSGAFTYHLPTGYDSRNAMKSMAQRADKLFGIDLTPEVLWNIAPWSWAVDWFSNTGDVISNLSDWATDGLVMQYGYMMEHTISKYTYSMDPSGTTRKVPVSDVSFVTETKRRVRANPFGFGITWDGLSPRQGAILTALGLSRSR